MRCKVAVICAPLPEVNSSSTCKVNLAFAWGKEVGYCFIYSDMNVYVKILLINIGSNIPIKSDMSKATNSSYKPFNSGTQISFSNNVCLSDNL